MPGRPLNLPLDEFDKRVFIGGNYDFANLEILRELRDYVATLGFIPILALDFDIPFDQIHDWDLRLLHACKYAVFDVTDAAGELMEIERLRDFGTQALLIYGVRTVADRWPERVASMLRTCGHRLERYTTREEREALVREFLRGEGDVQAFIDAFGYRTRRVEHQINIRQDGSADVDFRLTDLEVEAERVVPELHHAFQVSHGEITEPVFRLIRGRAEWVPSPRSSGRSRLGRVVFGGALRQGDQSVSYHFRFSNTAGSYCLTDEERIRRYSNDPVPYESTGVTVSGPYSELIIDVTFPAGYEAKALPLALKGNQEIPGAMKATIDTFERVGGGAPQWRLRVSWPRILHQYLIYWEPPGGWQPSVGRGG